MQPLTQMSEKGVKNISLIKQRIVKRSIITLLIFVIISLATGYGHWIYSALLGSCFGFIAVTLMINAQVAVIHQQKPGAFMIYFLGRLIAYSIPIAVSLKLHTLNLSITLLFLFIFQIQLLILERRQPGLQLIHP